MRGLASKVVIVTGGGGGIGGPPCRRFAAEGARVAVFDVNENAAAKVADDITANGGMGQAFACDITDYAGVQRAVAAAALPPGTSHPLRASPARGGAALSAFGPVLWDDKQGG